MFLRELTVVPVLAEKAICAAAAVKDGQVHVTDFGVWLMGEFWVASASASWADPP
jgi:hypothetical protein